jgi:alkyl hydroperoxide reductase subunit AhpF
LWRRALDSPISRYGDTVQYITRKATKLRKIDATDGSRPRFEIEDDQQQKWIGRKVILGTGIEDRLPQIPGFDNIWGRSAIHCVFCHGTETKGQEIAILLDPAAGVPTNGKTLSTFIQKFENLKNDPVTIIANGIFKEGEEPKPAPAYGISPELLQVIKYKG